MKRWKQGTPVFWDVVFVGGILVFLGTVFYLGSIHL